MKRLKYLLTLYALFVVNSSTANYSTSIYYSPAQVTEIIYCDELVATNMSWLDNRLIGSIDTLINYNQAAVDAAYKYAEVVFRYHFDCAGKLYKLDYIRQ